MYIIKVFTYTLKKINKIFFVIYLFFFGSCSKTNSSYVFTKNCNFHNPDKFLKSTKSERAEELINYYEKDVKKNLICGFLRNNNILISFDVESLIRKYLSLKNEVFDDDIKYISKVFDFEEKYL